MQYEEALRAAKEFDKHLTAYDFHDGHCVMIQHEDKSLYFFNHAFMVMNGDYCMVFTEHHGFHVFHKDEVVVTEMETKNVSVPQEEDPGLEDEPGVHKAV